MEKNPVNMLAEVSQRIREMREVSGISVDEMALKTEVSVEQYLTYEKGEADLPFTFIHKCSLAFGIEMTELLEGSGARLSSYTVTRREAVRRPRRRTGSRYGILRRCSVRSLPSRTS